MASPDTDASFFEALEEDLRSSPHASNDATRRLTFFEPGLISGAGELASDEDALPIETAGDFEFEAVNEYVAFASPNDASHPDQPPPKPGDLAGSVIDADGLPSAGVVVSVRRFDGKPCEIEMRFQREYKPYTITAKEVRADHYVASSRPKNSWARSWASDAVAPKRRM